MKTIGNLRAIAAGLWIAASIALLSPGTSAASLITKVDSVGFTVSDMDRSVAFYKDTLNFKKISDVEVEGDAFEHLEGVFGARARVVRLQLGLETLELTQYLAPIGRPIPADSRSNDHWFQHVAIIVSDMDKAYASLRARNVKFASSGPQLLPDWNKNAGGISAFYFKDPDNHTLEILHFPEDKGLPEWHKKGSADLFLGIDHTAIVVADTQTSLKFYRDKLGLKVIGESENYGVEQEHLNNVFGARLRITRLQPETGPGIEFLEYLSPGTGRPIPLDTAANDIVHWETRLVTSDIDAAGKALVPPAGRFVSPGVIALPNEKLGFTKGLTVGDPQGHILEITEK